MRRIFNTEIIKIINLFESLTKAKVKDCVLDDRILLIVEEGNLLKAVGKKGVKIKKIENLFKKKIKVVEYNNDVKNFIKNMLYPMEISNIYIDNDVVNIEINSNALKSKVIGRDSRNLKKLKSIVSRYFKIKDIKII